MNYVLQVRCDFEEMAEKYCPEFDLKAELTKDDKGAETVPTKPRRKVRAGRRRDDTINTSRMRGTSNRFGEYIVGKINKID